jgi:pyruvate dehydrogenase (quinone)
VSRGRWNLNLIDGLFDAQRSRVPARAIAAQIPQRYFRESSVFAELVTVPEQLRAVRESRCASRSNAAA